MDIFRRGISFLCIAVVLFVLLSAVLNGVLVPYDGLVSEMRPMGTLRVAINDYFEVGFGSVLAMVFAAALSAGAAFVLDPASAKRA